MDNTIKCAFCKGTGKDPFDLLSKLANCLVCNCTGRIIIEEPHRKCVFCRGIGINPLGARVTCIVCGGKGSNHLVSNVICKKCRGNGKSNDGLPCTNCGGIGFN
jgi:DnaJ-class molecular chaperone